MVGTALREYNNDDRASEPMAVYQERQFLANERHAAPISLEAAKTAQVGHHAKHCSASTRRPRRRARECASRVLLLHGQLHNH
jgi:hypothetical protein